MTCMKNDRLKRPNLAEGRKRKCMHVSTGEGTRGKKKERPRKRNFE